MSGYFNTNKPKSVLAYILYPLWMPVAVIVSKKQRQEAFLFLWCIVLAMGFIAVKFTSQFTTSEIYTSPIFNQFLTRQILFYIGSIIIFLALSIPLFVTLISFQERQKNKAVKAFGGWALFVTVISLIIFGFSCTLIKDQTISHQHALQTAIVKIKAPKQIAKVEKILEGFYLLAKKGNETLSKENINKYNLLIKDLMGGIFSKKEAELFSIVNLKDNTFFIKLGHYPIMILDQSRSPIVKWEEANNKGYDIFIKKALKYRESDPTSFKEYFNIKLSEKALLEDLKK